MDTGPKTTKTRRWLRRLIWCGVGLALLLVMGWFTVTSETFVKRVVLPRVGKLIHAELTADSVQVHGLSSVTAQGVRLTPESGGQLIETAELEVHYGLSALLNGIVALNEIRFVVPRVTIRQEEHEQSNLVVWIADFKKKSSNPSGVKRPGNPLQFAIGNVEISGGELEYLEKEGGLHSLRLYADGINLALDQFRNGESSKVDLVLSVLIEQLSDEGTTNDYLRTALKTSAQIDFAENLFPTALEANLNGHVDKALGRFRESFGLETDIMVTSSNSRLRSVSAVFSRDGTEVGHVAAKGELDYQTRAGEMDVSINRLPPVVLELLSLKSGWDIELDTFSSTNHLVLGGIGGAIQSSGRIQVGGLSIQSRRGKIPEANIELQYDSHVQPSRSRGGLNAFSLFITTEHAGNATASIGEPFEFAWSESLGSETGSRLKLVMKDVVVGEWRGLTGKLPVDGKLNLNANLHSRNGGQSLAIVGSAGLDEASLNVGTNVINQLKGELAFDGTIEQLQSMSINSSTLSVSGGELKPVIANVSGTMRFKDFQTDLKTTLRVPVSSAKQWVDNIPDPFKDVELSLAGDVVVQNRALEVDGIVGTSAFDLPVGHGILSEARLNVPLSFSAGSGRLEWKVENAHLSHDTGESFTFNSFGQFDSVTQSNRMVLELPEIPTDLINRFATNYLVGLSLGSGRMFANVHGEILSTGRQRWIAELASTNIVFLNTNGVPVTGSIGDRVGMEVVFHPKEKTFELVRLDGEVFSDGKQCGEIRASGDLHLLENEASLKLRIQDLDERALGPIAPLIIGDKLLKNVDVDAVFNLNYKRGAPSGLSAEVGVNDLRVDDPDGHHAFEKQSLNLTIDSDLGDHRIDVGAAELRLAPTGNASNVVSLSGWVDYQETTALRGELKLKSAGFDITPIYDLLSRPRPTVDPKTSQVDRRLQLAKLRSSELATTIPFDDFRVSVDVEELFFRELVATNWIATVELGKRSARLDPFSISLNGAAINLATTMTSNPDHFDYFVVAEMERVPLYPIVKTFYPDWVGLAKADIYSAINLKGRIERDTSLWSMANGHLYVGVTNAHAELMSARWQDILRPVGLLLQTPELFSSPVNWFYSHTELGDEELRLHQYTVMADAYIADLNARIALNEDFVSSPIPNVPVHLYLTRNLLTQLHITQEEGESSTYVLLPKFLYLQGTFEEPNVDIDKLKTSGMVLGKAGDFVGGTAGDVLKGAGEISEGIGGVVSGRKLVGTNVNLGPVSHGIDFVFRSIGGIFGGTGDVVDKGTGVVTGTEVVGNDDLAGRFHNFDWPRRFTNAPNSIATMSD